MTNELQNKLYEKYPKIFRQKDLPMSETAMCWGIDCGDGWFLLLDCLCALIQTHIDTLGLPQIEAIQVKEKFGGLRFYYNGGDDTIHKIVELFDAMSYNVCEKCGSFVEVTQNEAGWIQTLCKTCRDAKK